MPKITKFEITEQHLILLKGLYVQEGDRQIPEIDSKRPFGNSNITSDVAELLELSRVEVDDGDWHWPKGTTEKCNEALIGLFIALQICLSTQSFEIGKYRLKEEYDQKSWVRVPR